MSGGHWEYKNDTACGEIFDWELNPVYGLGGKDHKRYSAIARKLNPCDDVEMSELVYDVFCLLHSFDWYASGDNCRPIYQADVDYFKNKWFKSSRADRMKEYVDYAVSELRQNLLDMIGKQEAPDAG